MAPFCHFWGMTPAEYWALPFREHQALTAYANRVIESRAGGD